jgi:integrase/recombinase XerD
MAEGKRLTKRTNIPKSISEIYEEFQKYNAIKNLSEHTITYYYWNLKHLFDYLNEQGISNIQNITSDTIDNFTLWLKKQYDNSITINTYLRSARVYLYYAMKKEYLSPFQIHLIKQEEKVMRTYSDDDILKLIQKPNFKTCSFVDHRDWVLVNYFIETGNRLRSVLNIKVADLDFNEHKVVVRVTKNREQQGTPLTKTLLSILPEYIELWGLGSDSYLLSVSWG